MTRISLLICALVGCAKAEEVHVQPGESPRVALRSVASGGVLVLHEGCLSERIDISKPVTLESADGQSAETLDINIRNTKDVTISRIQVLGSASHGIAVNGSDNVAVTKCNIQSQSGYFGAKIYDSSHVSITDSNFTGSKTGVMFQNCSHSELVHCDIGRNGEDGINITNGSHDITVEKCRIHHHLGEGYPKAHTDGVQTYVRGDFDLVRNVHVLDNEIFGSQQCFHFQDTDGMTIRGNTLYGFSANAVTLGYGTANNVVIEDNTIAFAGLSIFNFTTCHGIELRNNILVSGNDSPIYSAKGVGLTAEDNVLWNVDRRRKPTLLVSGIDFRTLEPFRKKTGLEEGSQQSSPKFSNAPVAIAGSDPARFEQLTTSWIPLFKYSSLFEKGDFVEVDFDGVARKCLNVRNGGIDIDPPLSKMPDIAPIVVSWGENSDFQVDLSID